MHIGIGLQITAPRSGPSGPPPPVASNVAFTGSLISGQQQTGSYDYAGDNPEGATTYQWFRADDDAGTNAAAISGATSLNYTATDDDVGKYLLLAVTPVDDTGAVGAIATSDWGGTIAPVPTTWNPADKNAGVTLSNGNLTAQRNGGLVSVRGTRAHSSGKRYFEVTNTVNCANFLVGFADSTANILGTYTGNPGDVQYSQSVGYWPYQGGSTFVYARIAAQTAGGAVGGASTTPTTFGASVDFGTGVMNFYRNGSLERTFTATGAALNALFPALSVQNNSTFPTQDPVTANFAGPFVSLPSGYLAWDEA